MLALLLACARQQVPAELIDVWRTRAPGYEDRFLEVRPEAILFGTGGGTSSGFYLDRVEVEPDDGDRLRCTLHYRLPEGEVTQVQLAFEPGPPATLRVGNLDEAWHRESEASWLAERQSP
jgi:hypothetical protein